jgi:hypothetical protein
VRVVATCAGAFGIGSVLMLCMLQNLYKLVAVAACKWLRMLSRAGWFSLLGCCNKAVEAELAGVLQ